MTEVKKLFNVSQSFSCPFFFLVTTFCGKLDFPLGTSKRNKVLSKRDVPGRIPNIPVGRSNIYSSIYFELKLKVKGREAEKKRGRCLLGYYYFLFGFFLSVDW